MHRVFAPCVVGLLVVTSSALLGDDFAKSVGPLLQEFCIDCHSNDVAEANVNLEQLLDNPDVIVKYKRWQQVAEMLRSKSMPPVDMPQPSTSQRDKVVNRILAQLDAKAKEFSGRPGPVTLRRLTNAEYAYTIEDLTGLTIDFRSILSEDAAGGEGFANVGDVQFVQDSTLERYLEAAKRVASHAVIGAGPLTFFRDPGQTGLELSAIDRIQSIYRNHGFRTAAGEGGEPYGLERYPNAFFAGWRYLNRKHLGLEGKTLTDFASDEHVDERFVQHVLSVVQDQDPSFPLSDVVEAWNDIGTATDDDPARFLAVARKKCEELGDLVRRWQDLLAATSGDDEEAALMADDLIELTPTFEFEADARWPEGTEVCRIEVSMGSATEDEINSAKVIWQDFTIRFRADEGRWTKKHPIRSVLPSEQAVAFGPQREGSTAGTNDLVMVGPQTLRFDVQIPPEMTRADIDAKVTLLSAKEGHVVRCAIADLDGTKETEADTGRVSALLADPKTKTALAWQKSAVEFAKALPQISHREPAPSDRDPIPAPYDNSYNNPERNDFHYKIKYHRNDRFLVDSIVDDQTRQELDQAWHDLLTSFDYHDLFFVFTKSKLNLALTAEHVSELNEIALAKLAPEAQFILDPLVRDFKKANSARELGRSQHVEEAIRFAELAWRRPLSQHEQIRLRDFYAKTSAQSELNAAAQHEQAIRALIARILIAPAFLYRLEPQPTPQFQQLDDWQIASRMSYFLWSSPPDDELRKAAKTGRLSTSNGRAEQVRRMLRDPRCKRFATEFFGQWFGFYQFAEFRGIDGEQFTEFTPSVKEDLYQEAQTFFTHIVRNNRPVDEVLFADYTFLTRQLAWHYGLANVVTDEQSDSVDGLQRVEGMSASNRGGLLGMGTMHAITSAPLRTSAVKRGDWILRRLLGTAVPPPPADAGSIPGDEVHADGKTVRQLLERHRQDPVCAGCHSRIDPLGFALENFDPIGRWRTKYRDGNVVETHGTLKDGRTIEGIAGLKTYLQREKHLFHRTFARRLIGYALGRSVLLTDQALIDEMTNLMSDGEGIEELINAVVHSPQFLSHSE